MTQFLSLLIHNSLYKHFCSGWCALQRTETSLVQITSDLCTALGLLSLLILLELRAAFPRLCPVPQGSVLGCPRALSWDAPFMTTPTPQQCFLLCG